jgi:hypothetical protein
MAVTCLVALSLGGFPSFSERRTRRSELQAQQRIITAWFLRTSLTTESPAQQLLSHVLKAITKYNKKSQIRSCMKQPQNVSCFLFRLVNTHLNTLTYPFSSEGEDQ